MLRLDKFAILFDLETGGLLIGWLLLGLSLILFFDLAAFFVAIIIYPCNTIVLVVPLSKMDLYADSLVHCSHHDIHIGAYIIIFVLCIYLLISALIGFTCIEGIQSRNSLRLLPMMIILAISTVCSLICISTPFTFGVLLTAISCFTFGYFSIVIYSLCAKFIEESTKNSNGEFFAEMTELTIAEGKNQ